MRKIENDDTVWLIINEKFGIIYEAASWAISKFNGRFFLNGDKEKRFRTTTVHANNQTIIFQTLYRAYCE